jgi:hypothetical protein
MPGGLLIPTHVVSLVEMAGTPVLATTAVLQWPRIHLLSSVLTLVVVEGTSCSLDRCLVVGWRPKRFVPWKSYDGVASRCVAPVVL